MSSVPGGYFITEEFLSPARFNRKCNTHLSGADIATLNPTFPNQIVVCNATGSGFIQDTMYIRNSANTAWIGGSGGAHLHNQPTDAAGGLLSDVLHANLTNLMWINHPTPMKGDFEEEASSGTATKNIGSSSALVLNSGSANGNYIHLSKSGVGVSYASNIRFVASVRVSDNTNLSVRMGVTAENVNSSPSSTVNRIGLEACDSASTPKNWDLFTSNATDRTAETTPVQLSTGTNAQSLRLDYLVATNVRLFVNGAVSPSWTKTTDVPAGSGTTNTRVVGVGIKTNTNTFRTLELRGIALAAVPSGSTSIPWA